MFDIPLFAARYRLGLENSESLVRAADVLLAEGQSGPAVVQLSVLHAPIMSEAGPLFERVCAELGVIIPGKKEAVDELLRSYLEAIAFGARPAREGLEAIMLEIYKPHLAGEPCKEYVGDAHGLEHLIGDYWGYDDLMERPREVSWGGKHGAEAMVKWEESVRKHARDWFKKHGRAVS